jgi:hypothetical protein
MRSALAGRRRSSPADARTAAASIVADITARVAGEGPPLGAVLPAAGAAAPGAVGCWPAASPPNAVCETSREAATRSAAANGADDVSERLDAMMCGSEPKERKAGSYQRPGVAAFVAPGPGLRDGPARVLW